MASWIINHFPDHTCYIEPFGGGASVLVNKEPSSVEIYNDRDGDVVHFFRTLRERPDELVEWLQSRPYAKDLHEKYSRQYFKGYRPDDDVERAGRFFYIRRSQFAGKYDGYSGFRSGSSPPTKARVHQRSYEQLDEFAERFRQVTIENRDYREIFERFDGENVFFYCDPPYVEEGDALYSGSEFDHSEFANTLEELDAKWCVSYTDIPESLRNYTIISQERTQHMRKGQPNMKRDKRVERLVMNYDPNQTPLFSKPMQATLGD